MLKTAPARAFLEIALSDRIVFREANLQEAPAVTKIFKAYLDFHKRRDSYCKRAETAHRRVKEFLIKAMVNDDCLFLVVEQNCRAIVYCVSVVVKKPRIYQFRNYVLTDMIAVSEGCRKKGAGERRVKMSFDWFRSRDIHRVEVAAAVGNEVAVAFWKKLKFAVYEEKQYLNI